MRTFPFPLPLAARGLFILLLAGLPAVAAAQAAVPVGGGSYASCIPTSNQFAGGFFSMTAQQVVTNFANLHLDPALTNRPIPTSSWWTDLLVGDRSRQPRGGGPRVLEQDKFGGALWAYPAVVDPEASGVKLFFPNAWTPPANTNTPEGMFLKGPPIDISARVPVGLATNDLLLADFEGTQFPTGWTTTGTAFSAGPAPSGTWPGQAPAVSGFLGAGCANSARGGSDGVMGTLTSPVFPVQHRFIHLLVGGGSNSASRAVRLLSGTNVVRSASGRNSPQLHWHTWDVRELAGREVRIQLLDASSGEGGWGFVACDYIVASDDGSDPSVRYQDRFTARGAMVTDWGDWHVRFRLADAAGRAADVTLAQGVPFVWTTWQGLKPRVRVGANTPIYDPAGAVLGGTNGGSFTAGALAFEVQGRWLGLYASAQTRWRVVGDEIEAQLDGATPFLVVGLLPARGDLAAFAKHAFARVTGTEYSWEYEPERGRVVTRWRVRTEPLQGAATGTLQGWLPHAWRDTVRDFEFLPHTYPTPRGVMKLAAGDRFEIAFPFRGLAPVLPAPGRLGASPGYDAAHLERLVANFARQHPVAVGDSYGAGKEFGMAAQYLTFARELGLTNEAATLRTKLARLLADWLTYEPGERGYFFARYDNWRALIGFPPGFGSEAFNDQHFHYGYFALAGGLLGRDDPEFLARFGPMLRLVARQYANWDRHHPDFPYLRCFDPWAGHCWAGGFASANGNNQESISESIHAWVGLFLLGDALGDAAMTAAGAMGYAVESAAANEYWQDWRGENFPAGYGRRTAGILWSGGLIYGTYFSNDPAWIHGIQWVPASHWNHYLVRDPAVAAGQFASLWRERVQADASGLLGFKLPDANNAVALGGYLGNYVLGFQSLFDPEGVTAILSAAIATNAVLTTDTRSAAVVYYLAHAQRALGRPDTAAWTSLPTSQVYVNPASGRRTLLLHNSAATARTATYFERGTAGKTFEVPARSARVVELP